MNQTEDIESTENNKYDKLIDINEKSIEKSLQKSARGITTRKMANLQPLQGIYLLLERVYPKSLPHDLTGIIEINQGKMKENLNKISTKEFNMLTSVEALEKLNEDDKKWQKPSSENLRRKAMLNRLLKYLEREHIEMIDLDKIREMVPIKKIKLGLNRSSFINFSIKDKSKNMHLDIQGNLLQIFLFYHMKHDMRFKGKIDSLEIEMDNPFARQQIRDENRKDDFLGKKYLVDMEVDEWCKHLLENFFPNISGIWADHTHVTHVYILKIIRFCYECGFIDTEDSEIIINLLYRAVQNLLKLEEAWKEKLNKISKISDTLKANNVTQHFAKCRENIACILIQILTLYQDEYFIQNFTELEGVDPKTKSGKKRFKLAVNSLKKKNYPLLKQSQNEIFLFITMNYLSNTLKIANQNSRNPVTQKAVEKIFLYITTDDNDCFMESIKQITTDDLKYFDVNDPISPDIRDKCDNLGYTFKNLLTAIGMGYFDKFDMTMNKDLSQDPKFKEFLEEYISNAKKKNPDFENTGIKGKEDSENKVYLFTIVESILDSFRQDLDDEDFRVATVKESIPLMIVALADYTTEYFESNKFRKRMMKDLFDVLYKITASNNFCKGQIFKGDSLFHLRKLVERQNKYAFFYLNKLCDSDENIAIFLGRGFFDEVIEVYKNFQGRVLEDFEVAAKDITTATESSLKKKLSARIDVDDWVIYIILNNLFSKLMNKKFIHETGKLQSSLKIQEAIFPSLSRILMKSFLLGLKDKSGMNQDESLLLTKDLFKGGNEDALVTTLDKREEEESLSYYDLNVIIMQLSFSSIRAFNMACSSVFSDNVSDSVEPFLEELRGYLITSNLKEKTVVEPFGLDAEIVKLLRNFSLIPEANLLIERNYDLRSDENEVFDEGDPASENIEFFLKRAGNYAEIDELREEGEIFLMEGVLPYVYKYATTLLNLTRYEMKSNFINPYAQADMKSNKSANNLNDNLDIAKNLFRSYHRHSENISKLMGKNFNATLMTDPDILMDMESTKKKFVGRRKLKEKKIDRMTEQMIRICKKIMSDIEKYYKGTKYESAIDQFKEMSEEEFLEESTRARFQSKAKTEVIKLRKNTLNVYIKMFQQMKDEYLEGEENPNLINYFDKNTENLNGVFNSCIERIFYMDKALKYSGGGEQNLKLTKDIAVNRFWMNQSCYAYIEMLEKLISSSKTARSEFFAFLTEGDEEEPDPLDMSMEGSDLELDENERKFGIGGRPKKEATYKNVGNGNNIEDRKKLTGMLNRIQHDLLLFLNTSPTQKPIWWNIYEIYKMLCSFFQNLCENNFKEFKEYLGNTIPKTNDIDWNKPDHTCTEIFSNQLTYLLDSSQLATNRESIMIHTDQYERLQPLLLPLINTLNELVTGPCLLNQQILMSKPIQKIFQIMTRILDDLDHCFMELKHACLILVISLTEGFNKEIIEEIAIRTTPSIILNQVQRLTKKIYVSQLIKNKSYQSELKSAQIQKKKEIEERKKKKKKTPSEGIIAAEKNKSKLPDAKNDEYSKTENGSILLSHTGSPDGSRRNSASNKIIPIDGNEKNKDFDKKKMLVQSSTLKRAGIDAEEVMNFKRISQDLENSVYIKHWDTLNNYYLSLPHFSDGQIFDFTFRAVILWQSLCKYSKRHKSSLTEIREEAKDCFGNSNKKFSSYQREISSIFYFFDKIMFDVEIIDPEGKQILVYFPRRPECFLLSEEDKKNYREECNISDSNTKMLDLMRNFNLFRIQMDGNIKNYRTQKLMYFLGSKDAFAIYMNIAWCIGVLINVMMYLWISKKSDGNIDIDTDGHKNIIDIVCFILTGFSAFSLIIWFSFRFKQKMMIMREDFIFDNPGKNPDSFINKININLYKSIILSPTAFNMSLHIIFTFVGMNYSFFLLSLNLLLIINISRTTKYVIQSITLHLDQLILTLVMTLFVIFSFTLILAQNYSEALDNTENLCSDLDTCYIFTVNWGLRNGGGIADSMIVQPKGGKYLGRSVLDVFFFIIVNVIALNIIFGIIIDTFSQLRDEQHERVADKRDICFVCGNERSEFSKQSVNFEVHLKEHHDPWNYIYYVYYLKWKGEDELSGLEYFCWSQFIEKKTNWIPVGDTMYLTQGDEDQQLDNIENRMEEVHENVKNMLITNHKEFSMMKRMIKEMYKKMENQSYGMRKMSVLVHTPNKRNAVNHSGHHGWDLNESFMKKSSFANN